METIGARASHMEGAQAERECSAELVERENRYSLCRLTQSLLTSCHNNNQDPYPYSKPPLTKPIQSLFQNNTLIPYFILSDDYTNHHQPMAIRRWI